QRQDGGGEGERTNRQGVCGHGLEGDGRPRDDTANEERPAPARGAGPGWNDGRSSLEREPGDELESPRGRDPVDRAEAVVPDQVPARVVRQVRDRGVGQVT